MAKSIPKPAAAAVDWKKIAARVRQSPWAQLGLYWLVAFLPLASFFINKATKYYNYSEMFTNRLIFPLGMHALTALIIAVVVKFLPHPRSVGAKTVSALTLSLLMVDYDNRLAGVIPLFQSLVPIMPKDGDGTAFMSLMLLVIMSMIAVGIGVLVGRLQVKRPAYLTNTNIAGAIIIVVGFLFLNQVFSLPGIVRQLRGQESHIATTELNQTPAINPGKATDSPDIYFIILDRYTNNTVLKNQFGFDNSPFLDWLREQGFAVDDNAYAAYPYTAPSLASILNMSYHNDDTKQYKNDTVQSSSLLNNMTRNSEVAKLLLQQGYSYHNVGSAYDASNTTPLATANYAGDMTLTIFNTKKRLRDLEKAEFSQSPYQRFFRLSARWWPFKIDEVDNVSYTRKQLSVLQQLAANEQQGSRFVFAHILVPHNPFTFNSDGSINTTPLIDNVGEPIKRKYTNQIQFINGQMLELVSSIKEHSNGKAIISFVADEGPYPVVMNQTFMEPSSAQQEAEVVWNSDMRQWKPEDLAMKFGILQAAYIPGATEEDLANMAPVNAFRIILNRYFGYGFEYLPKCQMGLPSGRLKLYQNADVSQMITGQNQPACKQYE